MKYALNQQVEVYTQSGWQKGFVLGYKGEGCRVELQNGHIGLYDDKDIRPAHIEADGNEEQEVCPIRKRREQGQQEPKFQKGQEVQFLYCTEWLDGFVADIVCGDYGLRYPCVDNSKGYVILCNEDEIRPMPAKESALSNLLCPAPTSDPIRPNHYKRFAIDPIEYCNKNEIGFCAGNVIKYVSRFDMKGGLEDLDKAEEYLRRMRKDYAEKQAKAAQQN